MLAQEHGVAGNPKVWKTTATPAFHAEGGPLG
jgi:hypothetical protein